MTAPITRKAFCARLTGGTVVLLIQACGGGGSSYQMPASPGPAGATCNDTIGANHGHVLAIAATDLDATVDKVYDIQGSATHTHSVTLTVANLQALKASMTVVVVSSTSAVGPAGAHEHSVSILCA
jgi:hypothetical protein